MFIKEKRGVLPDNNNYLNNHQIMINKTIRKQKGVERHDFLILSDNYYLSDHKMVISKTGK